VLHPTKSRRGDLPGFLFFVAVFVFVLVVFVEVRILVKVFIINDFVVIRFIVWCCIHGMPAREVTGSLAWQVPVVPQVLAVPEERRVPRPVAWGTSSSNGGRIFDTPRTGSAAMVFLVEDLASPSDPRTAGSGP
jgi:hypothetical protein